MTAAQIVTQLLDSYNPYDIDDPLDLPSSEELDIEAGECAHKEALRLFADAEAQEKLNQAMSRAVSTYLSRKDRRAHPDGTFDRAGRWYPSDEEYQSCCDKIRGPTRAFPYSYMTHCRTVEHVANLCGVDARDLRQRVR